jgi:hypothetical protein
VKGYKRPAAVQNREAKRSTLAIAGTSLSRNSLGLPEPDHFETLIVRKCWSQFGIGVLVRTLCAPGFCCWSPGHECRFGGLLGMLSFGVLPLAGLDLM